MENNNKDSSGPSDGSPQHAGPLENAIRFQQRVQWFAQIFPRIGLAARWDPGMLVYELCPCCGYPKLFIGHPEANCFLCRLGLEQSLQGYDQLKDSKKEIQKIYDALIRLKDPQQLKILWTAARKKHGELETLVPEEYRFFL